MPPASPSPAPPTRDRPGPLPPGPSILFAGGGSGGHLSPGLAIGERLVEQTGGRARPVFACSTRAIDSRMLSAAGVRFEPTPARPFSPHPARLPRFIVAFRQARARCETLLRLHEVGHVVALGGFVSAPAVAAARRAGVPTTLLNLDDPPGRANRWTARRCDRVWSAPPLPRNPGFAERVVGLPIRRRALATVTPEACRARLGLEPAMPTLLVTGASQGATTINELLGALAGSDARMFTGWQILHLTGSGASDAMRQTYRRADIPAVVEPFLDEMGLAWGAASLAVSRAGANSVAEARANAVPTVFLPYPYHRDLHQENNARPMVDLGGAVIARDRREARANVAAIGPVVAALLRDEGRRATMRDRLERDRPPDAAATVAAALLAPTSA